MNSNVIVITGAGSGLGASLAKKYSKLGHHVCLLGRTRSKLTRTAETLSYKHSIYELDVTAKDDVAKVIQSIKEDVGSIDLLVNNAGVGMFDLAENASEESTHQMIMGNMKTDFWDDIDKEIERKGLMDPDDVADIIIDSVTSRQYLSVDEVVITNKES
ncbi:SDR family NAD(P)-dependent oxidoreductase [Aquibacillus sp. 3ASR75-11]|uniref:SDR family NAD(P)-dependent oxidoreductase n=1 Tax=Terrihalobacillus insolitus TaxID=2950438 RepID=A0A9X3WVA3_9BACI|nr:SDR family NAD(P)-dependent oxidoreductase [Terrihalobacillus insolitus]MDC3413124.1 SDR family NAD(P)-dependent oxidoreductase [Terrihalobacillus insolitus]MDC3424866.1 SDR family NAD(P)-dependent oxidoreductase [Terrihalobacillus insolitus]